MKVYLLPIVATAPRFYSEGPSAADGDRPAEVAATRGGFRGRLESWFGRARDRMTDPKGRLGPHLRRTWGWLQRFVGADEPLLRSLRKAGRFEVDFPASMSAVEAREHWEGYLTRRLRHHAIWLVVNGLLAAGSVALMLVPGPNVVGYWFAYRLACHGLALLGIQRARGGRIETTYHPLDVLDLLLAEPDGPSRARIAANLGLRAPAAFLRQFRGPRHAPAQLQHP